MLVQILSEIFYQFLKRVKFDKGFIISCFNKILARKNYLIQKKLSDNFKNTITEYQNVEIKSVEDTEKKIWVLWLQGWDDIPLTVSLCQKSIEKNKGNFEVVYLDEKNLDEYIQIPTFILDKYKRKKITSAHLSDIIRVMLLRKYGGVWLDSTCLLIENIPENILEFDNYTAKGIEEIYLHQYWVEYKNWESYFLSSRKNGILVSFLETALFEYWQKYDDIVDYLLLHQFSKIARDNISFLNLNYNNIPINNSKVEQLSPVLYKNEGIKNIFSPDTYVYKMNYKITYCNGNLKEYKEILNSLIRGERANIKFK